MNSDFLKIIGNELEYHLVLFEFISDYLDATWVHLRLSVMNWGDLKWTVMNWCSTMLGTSSLLFIWGYLSSLQITSNELQLHPNNRKWTQIPFSIIWVHFRLFGCNLSSFEVICNELIEMNSSELKPCMVDHQFITVHLRSPQFISDNLKWTQVAFK